MEVVGWCMLQTYWDESCDVNIIYICIVVWAIVMGKTKHNDQAMHGDCDKQREDRFQSLHAYTMDQFQCNIFQCVLYILSICRTSLVAPAVATLRKL